MSFIGNYADLTGYDVGEFKVESLAGRNAGAPRWRVVCKSCGHVMVIDHARLAPIVQGKRTQISLQCPICPASTASSTETFEQFRRRELREAKAAASHADEAAKAAEAAALKQRAADAQRLALQREYIRFWRHQLLAGTPEILSRQRWESLPAGTRQRILERIAADPTLQVSE